MWYLGYVRGGVSRHQGEQRRNEFIVQTALTDMGLDCWCGRKIEFKRTGKDRRAAAHESPYLRNYIFADIPPERFAQAVTVNLLANTLYALSRRDTEALVTFRRAVEAEYDVDDRRRANGAIQSEFESGQALVAVDGQFKDQLLTFRRLVERSFDAYPKIKADMEMMGQTVTVTVDPLDVRKA